MYETVVVSTVVMHFAFIAYVLAGGFLALRWRRTMWLHVPAVIWGIGIAAKRVDCPLTWVERWARTKAAMTPLSPDGFVAHYITGVIYPAGWVAAAQLVMFAIVAATCTSSPSTGVGFRANVALVSTARVDLVCEGGGVRGIGLVGAVDALADAGYRFPRVAGSSAGAIVASLVAALQTAGEPVTRLAEMMRSIDYPKFLDRNLIGHVPLIGGGLSLLLSDGVYRGAYLEQLLGGLLADLGVHTFGDLRTGEAPEQFAWSLVVTASDLSRRRLVRIPWDLDSYGIHPDDFSVARAVHASSAIPFVFEPVRVRGATWVDGGLLSNFPVALFDRTDAEPRWPTFGIRLSARPGIPPTRPVQGPVSLGIAAIETLVSNQDNAYIDDPCTVRRTIFVPAHDVSPIDFDITAEQREALYQRGFQAGQKFLANWNYADYLADCGGPFTPSL